VLVVAQFDHYDAKVSFAPHEVWRRLRNDCPGHPQRSLRRLLARHRYDDVKEVLNAWETFTAAKGTVLPPMFMPMLPGESDPPLHHDYRGLLPFGPVTTR
jgi:cytochrome P450